MFSLTLEEMRSTAPSYYPGMGVDFWLWDVRRLVADDTRGGIEELRRLGDTRYHDRSVSLYDGARWFAYRDTPHLAARRPRKTTSDDRSWVEKKLAEEESLAAKAAD